MDFHLVKTRFLHKYQNNVYIFDSRTDKFISFVPANSKRIIKEIIKVSKTKTCQLSLLRRNGVKLNSVGSKLINWIGLFIRISKMIQAENTRDNCNCNNEDFSTKKFFFFLEKKKCLCSFFLEFVLLEMIKL